MSILPKHLISIYKTSYKNLEVVSNEVLVDFLYYNQNDSGTDELIL